MPEQPSSLVLELHLRNHPGALSHVTGLFARRAFNLDALFCVPEPDRERSVIFIQVVGEPRLAQLEKQLERLYDVLSVKQRPDLGPEFFQRLSTLSQASAGPA